MKKNLVILGVIVAVILIVFGWWTRDFWWQKYQANKILREFAALDWAYKNDPYGSTTPEGTLALFIEALKKGDAELASNYFVPEKKDEYKKAFENWIKLGKVEKIISEISKTGGTGKFNNSVYQMSSVGMSNVVSLVVNFRKNEQTKKWLIESL
ncbi:MAG: hypothetical protein NT041_00200 [Candidatus Vogelbacteria bacterium]|nr:hypothetical protein [Candidatus Vogelbacteria bacterium]